MVTAGHAIGTGIQLFVHRATHKNAMTHLVFCSNPVMSCFIGVSLRRSKDR